jgi:hypothetical protein
MGREREPEICLRERRDNTAEGRSYGRSRVGVNFNRNKGAFMEVDIKPSGGQKVMQEGFKGGNMLRVSLAFCRMGQGKSSTRG